MAAHLRQEQRRYDNATVRFFGELSIDYSSRTAEIRGKQISFSRREFDILELLSLHAGQVFDREHIYESVWGLEGDGSSDTVMEHIRKIRMLKAGEGCVVRNPIPMEIEGTMAMTTNIEEGRTITVAGKKLQVLLSLNGYDGYFSVGNGGFVNGVQILVSDRLYPELTGRDHYAEFRPVLKADADREVFDQTLDSLSSRAAGTTWVSYEETDRQLEESAAQINLLGWGVILFIGLIGILNIINTVYTNIQTRVTEIGTQRAIGMSVGSLYRTFLWEGIYYGMYAAVLGGVAGYLCSILVEAAASDTLTLVSVPVTAILEAGVISVVSCLLATAVPLRRISKLSIVESVDMV